MSHNQQSSINVDMENNTFETVLPVTIFLNDAKRII